MSSEHKTFHALTIGSDTGIFRDEVNPTTKRFLEYCKRCGSHFTLCYTPRGYRPVSIDDRLKIFPTNSRNKAFFLLDGVIQGFRIIRTWKPQVVVAQDTFIFGLVGLILKKMFGLPLVVHYHSGFYTNPYWLTEKSHHRLLRCLGHFVSKRADVIRTVSTDIQRNLIREGFDPKRVFYATPPVEPSGFLVQNREKEKEIIAKFRLIPSRTFIFVGRLSKEKNLPMMLRATARLSKRHPGVKLMIIGRGPEEDVLRRLAHSLGLTERVIFVGAVPYNELKDYFRVSCGLLITSYYEGTAKVIKEAAFAGRATISTNTSGVSDTIKNGETGLVVPIGNEEALFNALDFFLKNPDKAKEMGIRAKAFILEKFDYSKDVDRIVDVWKQAALMSESSK